jgi:DNA-binding CsgD family transcriptional regulator
MPTAYGGDPALAPRVQLIGRDRECAVIDRLLAEARGSRGGALVLRGQPGYGKSALLDYARSRGSGMQVLRAVGVEPEAELPFAALHQLLRPTLGRLDRIPEVQASALRGALGIADSNADNRFVVALAVLSLLAEVATERPLLCLVDDAHSLDQPSADALSFAARRLQAEPIAMLFAARTDDLRAFPGTGLPDTTIDALDDAQAELILVDHYGSAISADVRRLICASAMGNPLALIEIPHALTPGQRSGEAPLPAPMPIGHDLAQIFLDRARRLPQPAQLLLLVAAAEGTGEAHAVLRAGRLLGIPPTALDDTEAAGLLHTHGGTLAFRHPILRTAVYQEATQAQRELVHGALVETLQGEADADRRAWHQAAPLLDPDDEVADELERTAQRARSRSGHAAAAAALRRAAELTSSSQQRASRLAAAARAALDAGLVDEAAVLVRDRTVDADADTIAELRHVQGELELTCGTPNLGAELLIEGAERITLVNPRKALRMLFDAALGANYAGDPGVMAQAARLASTLPLEETVPEAPLVRVLTAMATVLQSANAPLRTLLARALDDLEGVTDPRLLMWAAAAAADIGEPARHQALNRQAETTARRSMAVGTLAMVLEGIAWSDLMYGRVAAASVHSGEGLQLAVETGLTNSACFHRAILACVAAIHGDQDACTAYADRALETATRHQLGAHQAIAGWAVGLLHLGLGEWDLAIVRLQDQISAASATGYRYLALWALPDLVEAAAGAGRGDLAGRAADQLAGFIGDGAPPWVLALTARTRALATPSVEAREALLREALALDESDPRPFNRARILLVLGEHLRRQRRRAEARPYLRDAAEVFRRLGAAPWEKRAQVELRATGETIRRDDAPLTQLTPQELQIASLVAEGATNKDVAAHLFLSRRTVDYHLRKVFIKLGVSSRTELVRMLLKTS